MEVEVQKIPLVVGVEVVAEAQMIQTFEQLENLVLEEEAVVEVERLILTFEQLENLELEEEAVVEVELLILSFEQLENLELEEGAVVEEGLTYFILFIFIILVILTYF